MEVTGLGAVLVNADCSLWTVGVVYGTIYEYLCACIP